MAQAPTLEGPVIRPLQPEAERARQLFYSVLTDSQALMVQLYGWISVHGSEGNLWRLHLNGPIFNCYLQPMERMFCAHVRYDILTIQRRDHRGRFICNDLYTRYYPFGDHYAAQLLMLQTDETRFRAIAHPAPGRTGPPPHRDVQWDAEWRYPDGRYPDVPRTAPQAS